MSDLLAVGDLHLGRMPTRIPASIADGASLRELAPRAALAAIVETALAERVAAVLLAGDVVDDENASLESFGPLETAVRTLAEAGIETIAVVGNHDWQALPRIARRLPGLRVLGLDGGWEHHVVRRDGVPLARIVGWSFHARHQDDPPLATLPDDVRRRTFDDGLDLTVVGLLHGDLDVPRSRYAPLARADLAAAGTDAWLLGHVHAPPAGPTGTPPIGYLGCAAPCDPGEHGPRGAWLVDLAGGAVALRHVPLAPVRYARGDVDVTGAADLAALEDRLSAAAYEAAAALAPELDGRTRLVALRLRACGALPASAVGLLPDAAARARAGVEVPVDGARLFVEQVLDATVPALDLDGLAAAADPRGALVAMLRLLEAGDAGDPALVELLASGRERLREAARRVPFSDLEPPALDDDAVRAALLQAGRGALAGLAPVRGGG